MKAREDIGRTRLEHAEELVALRKQMDELRGDTRIQVKELREDTRVQMKELRQDTREQMNEL